MMNKMFCNINHLLQCESCSPLAPPSEVSRPLLLQWSCSPLSEANEKLNVKLCLSSILRNPSSRILLALTVDRTSLRLLFLFALTLLLGKS